MLIILIIGIILITSPCHIFHIDRYRSNRCLFEVNYAVSCLTMNIEPGKLNLTIKNTQNYPITDVKLGTELCDDEGIIIDLVEPGEIFTLSYKNCPGIKDVTFLNKLTCKDSYYVDNIVLRYKEHSTNEEKVIQGEIVDWIPY